MRRYEKYKDSGIEWIGEIPEHWESIRLKYIGYLYGGLAGKSANDFNQESNFNNKPFIPFTNICNNKIIDPNQLQQVVIEENEQQNQVAQGDLFFMMSSENFDDVGKSSILLDDLGETYLNSFCKGFRFTKDKYYPPFVNYQLLSKAYRSLVLTEANGYTRINLKIDKINDIPLKTPPTLDEQIAIANYLDKKTAEIDELIKQKEELLLLFEEEKTAIINHAVTKGIDHNVKLKDSKIEWLGKIPEHWELTKLKYVTNKIGDGIHTTPTYTDFFEIYFINGTNLENGKIRITEGTRSVDEEEYEKHRLDLKYGTILISLNGTIGKMAFYNGEKVILGKSAAFIECKQEINNEFVYYFLQSNYLKNCFEESFSGTTINNLSLHTLRNTKLVVPERIEQDRIVEFIKQNIQIKNIQIENTIKLIGFLKDFKVAMISEVATGKEKVI